MNRFFIAAVMFYCLLPSHAQVPNPGVLEWPVGKCEAGENPGDKPQGFSIRARFAVERRVDGKPGSASRQIWNLDCGHFFDADKKEHARRCALQRMLLGSGTIETLTHGTESKALVLDDAQWQDGTVRLTVSRPEVIKIALKIRCDAPTGGLFLTDFQARAVSLFPPPGWHSIEYRIPGQSSFDRTSSLELRGLRSPLGGRLEELVAGLKASDREVWRKWKSGEMRDCLGLGLRMVPADTVLQYYFSGYRTQNGGPTLEEKKGLWTRCLAQTRLSPDARLDLASVADRWLQSASTKRNSSSGSALKE